MVVLPVRWQRDTARVIQPNRVPISVMKEFSFIAACPACEAKNRVRLKAGSRVKIRCGRCGEQIVVDRRRMVISVLWQGCSRFLGNTLPRYLLWAVNSLVRLAGGLLRPLERLWYVLPWKIRKRMAWAALAVLAVFYFMSEGTIKASSLLLLAVLLVLATLAMIVAARGPSALRDLRHKLGNVLLRRCTDCGHRYFGWVRNCPNCGR